MRVSLAPSYTMVAPPLLSAGRPWAPPPDRTFGQTHLCRAAEHSEHCAVGESPLLHPLMPHPPFQVIVFNTVREMLGSNMPQGTVALCEGNSRLFVNTAQGWLRAEVLHQAPYRVQSQT